MLIDSTHDNTKTITGMRSADGTDPTAGSRDYTIEVVFADDRDPAEVSQMFTATEETFDLTEVEEVLLEGDGGMYRLRVGDVLTMRVVINN